MSTILDFIVNMVGEVPAELESLIYVIAVIVLLFIVKCFFDIINAIFGVTRWNK